MLNCLKIATFQEKVFSVFPYKSISRNIFERRFSVSRRFLIGIANKTALNNKICKKIRNLKRFSFLNLFFFYLF